MKLKFISMVLVIAIIVSTFSVCIFAESDTTIASNLSAELIEKINNYITVENSQYMFEKEQAILELGLTEEESLLVEEYINIANANVEENNLTYVGNNSFKNTSEVSIAVATSEVYYYWWGVRKYFSNSATNQAVEDLDLFAHGYALEGAIAALISAAVGGAVLVSASYCALLASRMDANNIGYGVRLDMTWALVYNVVTQYS